MASITSNRPAVERALRGLADTFNMRRRVRGGKGRLGDEFIDTAALVIEERTVGRQEGSDGQPLRPLSARYLARKIRKGLDPRILIATHTMMDIEQVRGRTHITATSASMSAGLDPETIQKVEYAEESGRGMYDLGRDGVAAIDDLCQTTRDASVTAAERA